MSLSEVTFLWKIIEYNLTDFELDMLREIIDDQIEYRKSQKDNK